MYTSKFCLKKIKCGKNFRVSRETLNMLILIFKRYCNCVQNFDFWRYIVYIILGQTHFYGNSFAEP